ncbi:MAG: FIST N-terminal domain-containing protein [Kofleriaceae bacterium]
MQSRALSFDLPSRSWSTSPLPPLDSARTLVLGFGAPELIDAAGESARAFEALARAYPRSLIIGCSSAGEIHGTTVRDHSLAVSVTRFDKTDLQLASLEVSSAADSFAAGIHLAKKLASKPALRAVLLLSEGLHVNGSELIRGLNSILPDSVVVTGGLSADGPRFQRTWVAVGDKLKSNVIAAVGFYGDHVIVGHGSKGGWDKFGPERVVTKADGNVLFELDGRPALQLYKEYLGDKAKDLPSSGLLFPLALRASASDDKFVVRTLLSVDHDANSLTFAGDIPKGHLAQLMKADFDRLIDGAGVAGSMTLETGRPPPDADALVVAISCVGRRLVLGARTEDEVEAVRDAVPSDRAHITGFYSYGEISPYATGHCDLHNQTMTLTVFSESPTPLPRAAPPAKQALALGTLSAPPRPHRSTPAVPMQAQAQAALPTGTVVRHALYDLQTRRWSQPLPPLDSARTLVLGFGAPELIDETSAGPRAFEALARAYPRSLIIGCSSAGEIHGTTVRDHSLAVSVTRFDKTDLQLASLEVSSAADSFAAGIHLAKKLASKPALRAVLLLSEGLHVNGSELIRGLNSILPDSVVVTGGLSADGPRFQRTWVAVGDKLKSNVIAAVGFYGDHVIVGHGSKGGWDKFGPERVVTKADGNVLFELDGRPALQLYKEYLGDKAKDLPSSGLLFPLALRASASDDKFVVRTLLSVDHDANSLTFAGDIPKGHLAQLMKADFDRLIDGAGVAGSMTLETGRPPPDADALVVAISCVGRRLVLGARTEDEVEAVRDAVPSDRAHITGFYSYGEISPYATGHCDLHNQTMTLTVFSESPTPLPRAAPPAKQALALGTLSAPPRPHRSTPAVPMQAQAQAALPTGTVVRHALYDLQTRRWSQPLPPLDSARTLVLGFGAPELIDETSAGPRAFEALARAYPRSLIIGCSSAGEIHGTTVRDHSLAVSVTRFDKTDLQLASLEVSSAADSFAAGIHLAKKLASKPALRAVLLLSEGLHVNGSELIRGLNSILPDSVVVTGGLSADGPRFQRTWVAVGDKLKSNVIAAVGFYGDHVIVGHGSKGGWDKFGPERVVTKADGNVLFELDGRPALQLYKEYLGDKAKDLPSSGLLFPLALRASASDDKFVVRTLLSVDHDANSLTFAGDIPKGHLAQLMKADFDRLIDGAGVAGSMTLETGRPPPDADALVVAISCVGRRLVLGARTEDEVEAVRDAVPSDRAHITGFYSYGEISPYATGHCDLHNQTMTLTVFSESPTPLPRAAPPRPAGRRDRPVAIEGTAPISVPAPTRPALAFAPSAPSTPSTPSTPSAPSAPSAPTRAARATPPPSPPQRTTTVHGVPQAPPAAVGTAPIPVQRGPELRFTGPRAAEALPPPLAPIVRLPRNVGTDAVVEILDFEELQLVRIRGRITESFKGEQLGRSLGERVAFDLADVDRVTSFGVREWLAMMAAAQLTESYFLRCSESVVNQLTMIRKFDGGARIASFFAPYLCTSCGTTLECLRDCERDAAELASYAPSPVSCVRCEGEARFDDDPRSYFAFAAAGLGVALPPDVRAIHDELAAQPVAPAADEIEKAVIGDTTCVRVLGKLSSQIRWRKILDGIEGALVIDLSATPTSDAAGIASLEQALHALPAEVAPISLESAPTALVERVAQGYATRLHVTSAAVVGYCPSCAVSRPASLSIDGYLADHAAGRPHQVVCKRCNGNLELSLDAALQHLVAQRQHASAAPRLSTQLPVSNLVVPDEAGLPAAAPPGALAAAPAPRGLAWTTALLLVALAGAIGALVTMSRNASRSSSPATPSVASAAAKGAAAAPPEAAQPAAASAWRDHADLPPAWVERAFSIDGDVVRVVGHAPPGPSMEAGLEAARLEATMRLIDQLYEELAGSPVHGFLAARVRRDAPDAARAVAERFAAQHAKDVAFERAEVATRQVEGGAEVYVRYQLPRAHYDRLLAGYRATAKFRGLEVAAFFPLLETALRSSGQLVIIGVERRSAAELAGAHQGDAVLAIGATPLTTLDAFRAKALSTWVDLPPRARMTIELESAGATKRISMTKPAPTP